MSYKTTIFLWSILLFTVLFTTCSNSGKLSQSTTYYVNVEIGNDSNSGTLVTVPFKTINRVNSLILKPGDQVLFASGQTFNGSLILKNIAGIESNIIKISSYPIETSNEKPIIDAKGYLNGVLIENCSFIEVANLSIKSSEGGYKTEDSNKKYMRCGVLVTTSKEGLFENIALKNLFVSDMFFEEEGFDRGKDEVRTANGKQSYGWGIRFINRVKNSILSNLLIDSCQVENVSHTGIKFTSNIKGYGIRNIKVFNSRVFETGGPGIQMSGVLNGHIANNIVNGSGSNNDSRKWGRGSGLWTWGSKNILIEKNQFKNAKGPGDSAGCHIDFNCKNVIVQYNLSLNNAGGFCEILGNNYNCCYRYNVSINDGYRVKGENGAFQEGKVFWLSGYIGKKKPRGPFNSYFYNNTIYVGKHIQTKIAVNRAAKGILIANNIFCFEGDSKAVKGDQYNPEKMGLSEIENVVFENNLYLKKANWPDKVLIQDENPIFGNPKFTNSKGFDIEDFIPKNIALIKNKGIEIPKITGDSIGLVIGLKVEYDILGNKIVGHPDMGAIELSDIDY